MKIFILRERLLFFSQEEKGRRKAKWGAVRGGESGGSRVESSQEEKDGSD